MRWLNRLSQDLNRWVQALISFMGIVMVVIVAVQVFSRYALNYSLFWSEELARMLLVWLTFFGATVAYYYGAHPGVDVLYQRLSSEWRKAAACVTHGAGLALFTVMIWSGIEFSWFVRMQITPALNLPKWIIMAVVPVSGVIFIIHGLAFLTQELRGLKAGTDDH